MNLEESDALDRLAKMRPSPSYYIAHGTKNTIQDIYGRAKSRNLAKRDSRWTFVFHDWNAESFPKSQLSAQVTFMQMTGTYIPNIVMIYVQGPRKKFWFACTACQKI